MRKRYRDAAILAALVVSTLSASAAGRTAAAPACTPQVHDGWVRITPGAMAMLAGYARLENPCGDTATVTGASSTAFADVSLHESTVAGGVNRMRPVPRLALAPGRPVTLRPGGLHLMLMRPTGALKPGAHVTIDFALEDGGSLPGDFVLRSMTP